MADPGVQASLHKNRKTTLPRIYNYFKATRFQDVNLMGRLYPESRPVVLSHWALPGGEGSWQQWTFSEVLQQDFTTTEVNQQFGPTWTTHWFKIDYTIPPEWAGQEVRLRWISGTEAAVWNAQGQILQGLSSAMSHELRTDFIISSSASPSSDTLYVEMAANRLKGAAENQDEISPPDPNLYFTLSKCELVIMDKTIYKLTRDIEVLHDLAESLESNDPRSNMAMYTANQMINSIIAGDLQGASNFADAHFLKRNGDRAHTLAVIGNCHIDSAWLWPYSVTKRKAARSFASQLKLMDDYEEHIFVASQAQQWAWVKQYFPELFQRIKNRVTEGRFLPVGSTWVEMDGNIPSGESFIRQFFYGQKFYKEEFGIRCKEFWLPDTFGYSAQIPAMMKHMELSRFLTQKMSWSMVNKFPHHNFTWEGVDGSTVLAHFPPGESYSMHSNAQEAIFSVTNLEDKGRVSTSAYLFGYGDGGGGPTQDMLERGRRLQDCDGCPKMQLMTPDDLFNRLEGEQHNMQRWVGELFLELHNGTYTSQAAMKQLCRLAEFKMRDTEFLLTFASVLDNSMLKESLQELEVAWKKILLNQFHDVLPGSGIGMIYEDATEYYQEAIAAANDVLNSAVNVLFGTSGERTMVAMNTLQWPRRELVHHKTSLKSNSDYTLVDVSAMGYATLAPATPERDVTVVVGENGNYVLENSKLVAEISPSGQVVRLQVPGDDKDVFSPGDDMITGNRIQLYDDEPIYWDAWDVMDYHLETRTLLNQSQSSSVTPVAVVESGPLLVRLRWSLTISDKSTLTQDIDLAADSPYLTFSTSVDWNESHKIMKVGFNTTLLARHATYDIQFGQLERPTNMNTSWDSARYEVCGHKWAVLSEVGWGLAVLNNSKYGWMARGGNLTLSLLKSPKAPDDKCDMRSHSFKYAIMPIQGSISEAEVVRRGYEFNNPLSLMEISSETTNNSPTQSLASVDGKGVVLHTIKPTDDGSGAIILRGYECDGARSTASLSISVTGVKVYTCNGYEEIQGEEVTSSESDGTTHIPVSLRPFQIYAYRLQFE